MRTTAEVKQYAPKLPAALDRAARLSWTIDVHSHAARLDAAIWQACSKRPRRAKILRPFVSADTMKKLQTAKSMQASLKGLDLACAQQLLAAYFAVWKQRPHEVEVRRRRLWRCRLARARGVRNLRRARLLIRHALIVNKKEYIIQLSDRFANAVSEKAQQELFRAVSHLRPTPAKGRSKPWGSVPTLHDAAGRVAASFEERQAILRDTFVRQEGGFQGDPATYCAADCPPRPPAGSTFRLTELPTLMQLEDAIHDMTDGKAPGPSGIGPAPWKANPAAAAKALLLICLKSHVRLCEPVQNRGSIVVSLFKQFGSVCDPKNHRSIALLNPSAKLCHKVLRPALVKALGQISTPLQQGCQPGSYSVALHHHVATTARIAQARRQCWAVLFLDLTSDYYRLVRETLHGHATDQQITALLDRLNIPLSFLDEVRSYVSGTVILQNASPHLRRMIAAVSHGTFFLMDATPGMTCTTAGSRPGDSIADVLFALAAADLMRAVEAILQTEDMMEVVAPGWADDVCWPVTDPDPVRLIHKITRLAEAVHVECLRRAMQHNYNAGKTEILLHLQGKHSYRTKQKLFGQQQAVVQLEGPTGTIKVGCVQKYKHLGTTITSALKAMPDLRRKTGAAIALAVPLAQPVFRRQDVPVIKRAELLRTLAFNKAAHGSATWILHDPGEVSQWAAGYTRLVRLLLPEDRHTAHPKYPSAAEACAATGLPLPATYLRLERLTYVATLAAGMHFTLWEHLQRERDCAKASWWQVAEEDVAWLTQACRQMPSTTACKPFSMQQSTLFRVSSRGCERPG